jgi:diguanylate cyclase (GGDEF)-like protein
LSNQPRVERYTERSLHRQKLLLRRSASVDAIVGLGITIILVVSITVLELDVFDWFFQITREYENYELDKISVGVLLFGLFSIVFSVRRVIDVVRLNGQITQLAFVDTITQLPNRAFAHSRLSQIIAHAKRHDKQLALLLIDCDRFKLVNDTVGHANGDRLIKSVGERLFNLVRTEDTLARIGGDEFLIIVDLDKTVNEVNRLIDRLKLAQEEPHKFEDWESQVNFSVGISVYPKDGSNSDELLVAADTAMYRAKESGRSQSQFYSDKIGQAVSTRYHLESALKNAIPQDQLSIKFQPLYDLQSKTIQSYEALLRWQYQDTQIAPEYIIEIAEESGFIHTLGDWVLTEAIGNAKKYLPGNMKLAINVSPIQFKASNFVERVFKVLTEQQFPIEQLVLEITESAILSDYHDARLKIAQLREAGIAIAIDDFGTGYSSLARLTELKVDSLKIDRGFIQKMQHSESDRKVIKAIIALATELHLKTIAEGVETSEQLAILKSLDCDQLQGFFIGKPMTGHTISESRALKNISVLVDS